MAKQSQSKGTKEKDSMPAPQEPQNTAVANYDYGEMAGAGFDNQTSADIAIPFLGVLQALSPELDSSDAKYIEGAQQGMLFNTVTQELYDGETGVVIVPCDTQHCYVEWVPRDSGGGIVGVHEPSSDVVQKAKAQTSSFNELKTEAGNDLMETFYIYAMLLNDPEDAEPLGPIVLSFTSTKIKVYKRIMTRLRTMKGNPPLFAHRLRVTTRGEKNKQGQPYKNFHIEPVYGSVVESLIPPRLGDQQHPLLVAGESLLQSIRGGQARAAHETASETEAGGDTEEAPF